MGKVRFLVCAGGCLALGMAGSAFSWDLTKDKVAYIVSDSHMDDQWSWTRDNTYQKLIGNMLHPNFALLRSYPRYVFNFGGAYRFMIVEHADSVIKAGGTYGNIVKGDWDTLKSFVSQGYGGNRGTWHICGKWINEPDVNMPCAESMIRHALYGGNYFEDKFGIQTSIDIHLPDCFGFGYALPTIACHTGIRGFDSHKFRLWGGAWGSAVCTNDRSIMKWYGPDSSFIYAAEIYTDHLGDPGVNTTDGNAVFNKCGVWMTYMVSGTGDQGGSNSGNRVNSLCSSPDVHIPPGCGVHAFWASSDSLWRQLVGFETTHPDIISKMSAFDGECIMTTHGTGCYTAHGDVKIRHRQCEINGLTAEPAAVIANTVAQATYPRGTLWHAWVHTLEHEFHDDLTGTSITEAYYNSTDATVPDLDTQATTFNQVRDNANTAIAQKLNTQVSSTGSVPVVVYNPIGQDRRDPVELDVTFSAAPAAVQVINPAGQEVPSQIVSKSGNTVHVLFIAAVPSVGYAVYEVKPAVQATAFAAGVSAPNATTLQNNYYTVAIDNTGDISQIQDKILNKALLSQPCRWEMRNNNSNNYPAWEMSYGDVSAPVAREVVDQGVTSQVMENGPVRATIKVTRTRAGSSFTHLYQLYSDSAGRRVVVDNTVNWNTNNTILKAGFYLSASNPSATFGLGIGTIDRPNMNTQRYEVPSQQWAAISNSDGTYGAAIMNTYKYGWSKMQNNSLHLTLIHTPSGLGTYDGDKRTHVFPYAIYGFSGNWRNDVENQTQRFNMPLVGFATTAHTGTLGNLYSFMRPDDPTKFQIMSCKIAEKSNNVIVRVRELNGQSSNVNLFFANNITGKEVNGCEKDVTSPTPVTITGNKIGFTIKRYSLRTFSVVPGTPVSVRGHRTNYLPGSDVANFSVGLRGIGKRTTAKFSIENGESIHKIYITDMRGRLMRTLFNGPSTLAGSSRLDWNGKNDNGKTASAGVYIVNVVTDRAVQSARMTVVQ